MTKIADLHCDTILALYLDEQAGKKADLKENDHHLSLNKMKQGDYILQNFALFCDKGAYENIEKHALDLYDVYSRMLKENADLLAPVYTAKDIEKNIAAGKISSVLTLEEGDVTFGGLAMLRNWYDLGVRLITLTWNYDNAIGHPACKAGAGHDYHAALTEFNDDKAGLSEFGKAYIAQMEKLGIIVDISHASDATFWDVYNNTTKPFVASHSNARALCSVPRNLSDEMILAIAKRGGLIGINFCPGFLRKDSPEKSYLRDIVAHIKYIADLAGTDVLALGSDFDGISGDLAIKDGSEIQKLCKALQDEGFSYGQIEDILYKNVLKFYQKNL
jgi:membrane dipeptidase